jgi:hypothetical protein
MSEHLPPVPLYRRTPTWVLRPNIDSVPWPGDMLEMGRTRIR